jgi:lysophospholipase L1-like esterase
MTATPHHEQTYAGASSLEIETAGNLVFVVQKEPAGLQICQRASDGKRGLLKHGHAKISGEPTAVAGSAMQAFVADFGIFLTPRHLAAWSQLERTMEKTTPDAFLLALVTNDMYFWSQGMLPDKSIAEIAEAYREHAGKITDIDPEIPIFITTSPPLNFDRGRQFRFNLSAMNDATFEAYPAKQIIDTFSSLNARIDLGEDGLHLSQSGHNLRAELVFEKLPLGQ